MQQEIMTQEAISSDIAHSAYPRGYVVFHEELGVFLGHAMGLAFWSKLDSVGQTSACTFESQKDAMEMLQHMDMRVSQDVRLVAVDCDEQDQTASIAAIMRAGLPGWIDESISVANLLPV